MVITSILQRIDVVKRTKLLFKVVRVTGYEPYRVKVKSVRTIMCGRSNFVVFCDGEILCSYWLFQQRCGKKQGLGNEVLRDTPE